MPGLSIPPSLRSRRIGLIVLVVLGVATAIAYGVFAARLSALRAMRASGPAWSFPTRVYSDGVPFREGRPLPPAYLLAHLEARGYREVRGRALAPGTFDRRGTAFEIALREDPVAALAARDSTPPAARVRLTIEDGRLESVERLGAAEGEEPNSDRGRRAAPDSARAVLGLEPVPIALLAGPDRTWRTWKPIARVPREVQDAIVASEDRRFERHIGLDVRAWGRALFANAKAGEVREGGSTITQQLARGLFLGRQRNLGRKLAEVPLALGIEIALSKRAILEMYLNSVYWGQAGSWSVGGIDAAAQWYFDAPVESLGVLEGATLAASIPAPNAYDPFKRPRLVRQRRNQVLQNMVESKRLDAKQARALARKPLGVRRGTPPFEPHPSYSGFVRDQLASSLAPARIPREGLVVTTAMDLVWQRQAERGLAQAVQALDGWAPREKLEGAFVAIEPGTGALRAMVGGRSPGPGTFNRAYQARRQTGSAIKPVVYAAALATGRYTPATTISDQPRTFQTDIGPWTPRNDDGSYHGEVTLVKALERSLNVATTNLVDAIGANRVAAMAARFGLGQLKPVKSIGLGSNESTLLDLTRAFAVFGDGGMLYPATAIRSIADHDGRMVARDPKAKAGTGAAPAVPRIERPSRAIPEPIASLMTGLLTAVVRFGVAYPLRNEYGFTRPAAGKTGTTDDYKDAWFVGFTPDIVAGVWIGYDRPKSLGRLAARTALPAWAWIVGPMLEGYPPTPFASDAALEWRDVDPWSGRLAAYGCPAQPVPFLPGTAPTVYCDPGMAPMLDDWGEPYGPEEEPAADTLEAVRIR